MPSKQGIIATAASFATFGAYVQANLTVYCVGNSDGRELYGNYSLF